MFTTKNTKITIEMLENDQDNATRENTETVRIPSRENEPFTPTNNLLNSFSYREQEISNIESIDGASSKQSALQDVKNSEYYKQQSTRFLLKI